MPNRLALTVLPAARSAWARVETRPLVDGRDLIDASGFAVGPGESPDLLVGPGSPLCPGESPSRARIAVAECDEGCCGALSVQVRREGGEVVWDGWRDTSRAATRLGPLRFDAGAYLAELDRADRERHWEWPGWTLARLLKGRLAGRPEVLEGRWDTGVEAVTAPPARPDVVEVLALDGSVRLTVPVTGEPYEVQVERALRRLEAGPGTAAEGRPGPPPGPHQT